VGKQRLADVIRAGEEVGMANLLHGKGAAQQVDGMFLSDDVPARLYCLLEC
jgi:hypothetical protein